MRIHNAYGDFSRYYDMLGWNMFARNAAVRLRSFFRVRGQVPRTILDLACGTGELEKQLEKTGVRFTGVDASAGMIAVARRKCRIGKFVVGDAATIRCNRRFDMVLLLFDSANHMNSLSHLLRVFRNARRHLKPGGFFIFDFLTDRGLEEWEQINIRRERDYTLFWYGHYYSEKMLADIFIEAFIRRDRDYSRVFQKIVEKTYPATDIIHGLMKNGFEKIAASAFDPSEKIEDAARLWFICS